MIKRIDTKSGKTISYVYNLKDEDYRIVSERLEMSEDKIKNVIDEETGFKTKITEIKNLNSFKAAQRAMEYEEKRHIENVKNKIEGKKETRRWDEEQLKTIVMRQKEEGNDYRFSVEADIPYIHLEKEFVEQIKENMPELPKDKKKRFIEEYKISDYDAQILTQDRDLSLYFEKVVSKVKDANLVSNWLLSDVLRRVKDLEIEFENIPLNIDSFAVLLNLVKENKINANVAKKLLRELFEKGDFDVLKAVEERGLVQISDDNYLIEIVNEVLKNNKQSIEDYKNGKDRALGFLMGQCMKASKGKGNPQKFNELILERLV